MANRMLAAILFSDIKGFSSAMHADEVGTLEMLRLHNDVMERHIAAHGAPPTFGCDPSFPRGVKA